MSPVSSFPALLSPRQMQLLRRAQRAFRAHIAQQAADAQELAEQTRRDAGAQGAGHVALCKVLRRAAAGEPLESAESSLLAQVRHAVHPDLFCETHEPRPYLA